MVTAAEMWESLLEVGLILVAAALDVFLRSGSSGEGRRVEGSC